MLEFAASSKRGPITSKRSAQGRLAEGVIRRLVDPLIATAGYGFA
jgi:hypothetical protein